MHILEISLNFSAFSASTSKRIFFENILRSKEIRVTATSGTLRLSLLIALERVILIRRSIKAIPREVYRRDIAFFAARSKLHTGRFEYLMLEAKRADARRNRCGILVDRHV